MSERQDAYSPDPARPAEHRHPDPPAITGTSLDPFVVREEAALRRLVAYLLCGGRSEPVIALSPSPEGDTPALSPTVVRALVGEHARVYFIPSEFLLGLLEDRLGSGLALPVNAVRIWWPELTRASDPASHPLVLALGREQQASTLAELADQLHLSDPGARRHPRAGDESSVTERARSLSSQRAPSPRSSRAKERI